MKRFIALLIVVTMMLAACDFDDITTPEISIEETTAETTVDGPVRDGDYIYFGNYYEHTGHPGFIKWKILKEEDGKLLIISTDVLDHQPYNSEKANVTWETCSLRAWLNDDFINVAFSASEQKYIITTTISNPDNPDYGTEGGNDTEDKIFLLSIDEVNTFYPEKNDRYRDSYWWLRSPGQVSRCAACIGKDGWATSGGYIYNDLLVDSVLSVRPVMWIQLKS